MFLVVFPFWRSQLPRFLKIKDKWRSVTAQLSKNQHATDHPKNTTTERCTNTLNDSRVCYDKLSILAKKMVELPNLVCYRTENRPFAGVLGIVQVTDTFVETFAGFRQMKTAQSAQN